MGEADVMSQDLRETCLLRKSPWRSLILIDWLVGWLVGWFSECVRDIMWLLWRQSTESNGTHKPQEMALAQAAGPVGRDGDYWPHLVVKSEACSLAVFGTSLSWAELHKTLY